MESIRISKQHRIAIALLVIIAVLGTAFVEYFIYNSAKARLIDEIQQKMFVGGYATAAILGEDYHNELLTSDRDITRQQEISDAYRLTDFAQKSNFDYVYTMIKPGDDILFVSSSITPEELAKETEYERVFLTKYEEAPEALKSIFSTMESNPAKYSDRWGSFFSVFIPMRSSDGTLYVVGVDKTTEHVREESRIDALVAMAPLMLIFVLSIPITWLLIYSLKWQANNEIARLYKDNITGLANRNKLNKDLEETSFPVLFILNIDRFREISNTFGPAIGDLVLSEFGHHINCFKHPDLPEHQSYRLQGDEFAVLMDYEIVTKEQAKPLDDFYEFANNFKYMGMTNREVALSVTIGGTINQGDCILLADIALRHAKFHHKGIFIYDDQLGIPEIYRNNLKNIEQLRLALQDNRVVPYFQPITYASTGEVSHYEVLARMVDDQGKLLLNPVDFIPLAERYRLYSRVTKAILESTLLLMEKNDHQVCFNLSIKDIEDPDTAQYILSRIKKSGMANRILIELLEHESMHSPKTLVRFFLKMRKMGCKVGIDDLGREYSNFDRIMELPLDFIKIDGAVIHHAAKDKNTFDIVEKFVVASKAVGVETVAECIDSEKVEDAARRLGVDYLQGFSLGIPTPDFRVVSSLDSVEAA